MEEQPDGAGVFWRAAQSVPLPLGLGSRLTKRLPRPSATVCYARMIFMGVTTSKWTEKGQKKVGVVIDIV